MIPQSLVGQRQVWNTICTVASTPPKATSTNNGDGNMSSSHINIHASDRNTPAGDKSTDCGDKSTHFGDKSISATTEFGTIDTGQGFVPCTWAEGDGGEGLHAMPFHVPCMVTASKSVFFFLPKIAPM